MPLAPSHATRERFPLALQGILHLVCRTSLRFPAMSCAQVASQQPWQSCSHQIIKRDLRSPCTSLRATKSTGDIPLQIDKLSRTSHLSFSLQNSKEIAKLRSRSISGTQINRFPSEPAPAARSAWPGLRCKQEAAFPSYLWGRPHRVGVWGDRSHTDLSRQ